jgi:hypothetical protein
MNQLRTQMPVRSHVIAMRIIACQGRNCAGRAVTILDGSKTFHSETKVAIPKPD